MGLIRKSLFLGTGGLIAPNSKKQRTAKQQLAALQGKSDAEVRRAGGRYEHVTPGWQALGAAVTYERPGNPPGMKGKMEDPRNRHPSGKARTCLCCGRGGVLVRTANGGPHMIMGRKWCPGNEAVPAEQERLERLTEERHAAWLAHGQSDQAEARSVVKGMNQWQQDQSASWRSDAVNRLANFMRDNPEPDQDIKR
jgi:hypothetical protein